MAPRVLITHKLADEAVDVARQSCEVHFTPLDRPVDAPAGLSPRTDQQEPRVRPPAGEQGGRPQERLVVLHRIDPRDETDERGLRQDAELVPHARPCGAVGPEAVRVDSVRYEEPGARPVAEPAMMVVTRPRVDHDAVRVARGEAAGV